MEPIAAPKGMPRWALLLAILLIAVGLYLRLFGLDRESLWFDEIFTWRYSSMGDLASVIDRGAAGDVHPPLYLVLWHFWIRFAGDSEWSLRFPSVMAGFAAIPAMFHLGRRSYSWREGLISAALMTISFAPLYYSQEARAYSFVVLLTIVVMIFSLRILESVLGGARASTGACAGYAVSSVLLAYLHYFGLLLVLLLAAGGLLISIRRRTALLQMMMLHVPLVVAYAPWLPVMKRQRQSKQDFWIADPDPGELIAVLRLIFSKSDLLVYAAILLYLSLLLRWIRSRRGRGLKSPPATLLTTFCLVAPILVAYLFSELMRPILTRRNLLICLPAAYLLLSRATRSLRIFRAWLPAAVSVFFVLATAISVFWLGSYYGRPHKQQWREAAREILEHSSEHSPAEDVSVVIVKLPDYSLDYYLRPSHGIASTLHVRSAADLVATCSRAKTSFLWVVSPDPLPARVIDDLRGDRWILQRAQHLCDLTLWLLHR